VESLTASPRLAGSPQGDSLPGRIETKRSSWPLRPEVKSNALSSADTVGLRHWLYRGFDAVPVLREAMRLHRYAF